MRYKYCWILLSYAFVFSLNAQEAEVEVCGHYDTEQEYKEQAVVKVLERHGNKAVSGYESSSNGGDVATTIDISSTLSISAIHLVREADTTKNECRKFVIYY